jgi:iron complex outermembrane recepter protein
MKFYLSARTGWRSLCLIGMSLAAIHSQLVFADDATTPDKPDEQLQEVEVVADKLHVLQNEPNDTVFGIGKSILDTPRALSTISNELLDRANITDINDLVALTPGSFTTSFFGTAGSLDIRGTAGENYFRGIREIDNPGNYPTAIGASDQIDIVRGPASPVDGPSKVGGYMNFIPKSARADSGEYLPEDKGEIGVTTGSWDERTIHAELGGPSSLFGEKSGFYIYSQIEDSGSYYENSFTRQQIYQGSYNVDFSDTFRTESGGMYQNFAGTQIAGWNRVTQALINNGTYITGSPASQDTNGNGYLDVGEANAAGLSSFIYQGDPRTLSPSVIASDLNPNMALVNPGIGHLSGNQVLVAPGDGLDTGVTTFYFDAIWQPTEDLNITNKSFFQQENNVNNNAYGFTQQFETWAVEDQVHLQWKTKVGSWLVATIQTGPQFRHQDFHFEDDDESELFDRRDLTLPATAISPIWYRSLPTEVLDPTTTTPWSDHTHGYYNDAGYALLVDTVFFGNLDLLAGARFDNFFVHTGSYDDTVANTAGYEFNDTENHSSWSTSLSYSLPLNLRPYVTIARQATLTTGEAGEIDPTQLYTVTDGVAARTGDAVAGSKLNEYGLKGSWLGGHLYWAADYFQQNRTDYNSQDLVSDNSTLSKGEEFETRWVINPIVTMIGSFTNLKIWDTTVAESGQFSYVGAQDVPGVNPALFFGGQLEGVFEPLSQYGGSLKAGTPQTIYSVYSLISFQDLSGYFSGWEAKLLHGLTGSLGVSSVDSAYSGFSKTVLLPGYTLVNGGLHFEDAHWKLGLEGKNITNARYFRSNFPDLFGSNLVLPEPPRNWLLSLGYKF